MHISFVQMLIIVLYLMFCMYDQFNTHTLQIASLPVFGGWFSGLILGDAKLGLEVGATLQLMSLGIVPYGGASVPDYPLGAVIGTVVAAMAGKDASYGLLIGIPISLLAIQLDVLARTATSFFLHQGKKYAELLEMKKCYVWINCGFSLQFLKYMIPMILVFIVGPDKITKLMDFIPTWFIGGFKVGGGLLPVIGIAILLRYMNAKNYLAFILIGFGLVSFLKVPMIGVAIFGIAIGLINYKNKTESAMQMQAKISAGGMDEDE